MPWRAARYGAADVFELGDEVLARLRADPTAADSFVPTTWHPPGGGPNGYPNWSEACCCSSPRPP